MIDDVMSYDIGQRGKEKQCSVSPAISCERQTGNQLREANMDEEVHIGKVIVVRSGIQIHYADNDSQVYERILYSHWCGWFPPFPVTTH